MKNNKYAKKALKVHKDLKGKIEIFSKQPLATKEDLSVCYTPGVGAVSEYIKNSPKRARDYTMKSNAVLVVSDGSSVLGLGNIGPYGALPVMEGKAMIFKEFAGIDAYPIVLDTQDVDEIVETIKRIAPAFGGINLEDIKAPECFEVERRLKKELSIPVMHDDQHGTAIVVLAGLINAAKVVKKELRKMKVVIVGAGAAGTAIAHILKKAGIKDIRVVDRTGVIGLHRKDLSDEKKALAKATNPKKITGTLEDAIMGTDVVIGVSGPRKITKKHIKSMNTDSIVFALANPIPEIMPEDAIDAGARVIATGRSDYPNQINNALAFPGVFRGALDNEVRQITDVMKVNAAHAIATIIKRPTTKHIIPDMFNKRVMKKVAEVIT